MTQTTQGGRKRLIICCDGTWMDSLGKKGGEPQSNVARISRVLRRTCHDGTHQIIMYDAGVGSSDSKVDQLTGGMLGTGLDRNIREVYNFICANYVDGDDIILIGFSRGAFTARSVADMIATVGLLTPQGLEQFYAVFEDYEHLSDVDRDPKLYLNRDILRFSENSNFREWETKRKAQYKTWLSEHGLTRHTQRDKSGADTWKFSNTQVSDQVENAFQALALDEPRSAFMPALWEKLEDNKKTNLKQVWFPGSHATVGGGWHDQQIANITLAWMCDQLSSVGVEFSQKRMEDLFNTGLQYSAGHPYPLVPQSAWTSWLWSNKLLPWANPKICPVDLSDAHRDTADCNFKHSEFHPKGTAEQLWKLARPWGLGQMRYPDNRLLTIAGTVVRHPGTFKRTDPHTNEETEEHLVNTNETVHSSVRVRIACQGLGTDDGAVWDCKPLTRREDDSELWKLGRRPANAAELNAIKGLRPRELDLGEDEYYGELYPVGDGDGQWQWVISDKHRGLASDAKALPEEPMTGYWERYLLALTAGNPDVWRWAEENPPFGLI
ncbi:peptidoglycan binding domain-containing protein [Colletotrichum sojae]|uniref:Peptidoglycan binding domain-containing protein n=1 Tax=Colletotrichum sojae TaxID=2175907 RepID=A0A8H6MVQ4_9PEZI|nr:peptidoglycan binding domain-containing protein [Colletotrichum sojae]